MEVNCIKEQKHTQVEQLLLLLKTFKENLSMEGGKSIGKRYHIQDVHFDTYHCHLKVIVDALK